jgi:hypothetical protein
MQNMLWTEIFLRIDTPTKNYNFPSNIVLPGIQRRGAGGIALPFPKGVRVKYKLAGNF